jgi:hypothetical protein
MICFQNVWQHPNREDIHGATIAKVLIETRLIREKLRRHHSLWLYRGTLIEGGRLSTVDLLINIGCFV